MLFLPHLMSRPEAAILNVSSGLAFTPLARIATYGTTKAALHSFTMSLRAALSHTRVSVVEIIPPAVNTELGGPGVHTHGEPLEPYADDVMKTPGPVSWSLVARALRNGGTLHAQSSTAGMRWRTG